MEAACWSASCPPWDFAQALAVSGAGKSMNEIQWKAGVPPGEPSTRFVVTPVAPSFMRRGPA
jgi:hypothetical protein